MEIRIIEANGWTKNVNVVRAITRVGSAATNDIHLPDPGIAPHQLQIFYAPELPSSCRVVNLAEQVLLVRGGSDHPLDPYHTQDIFDGDEIEIAGYRLAFQLPLASSSVQKSRLIEAALVFPEAVLRPDAVLTGVLRVKNTGERQGVQFQAALSGLPADCYQVDPIPLMYPGAEEEVQVRLFHRMTAPPAGMTELRLTISAPGDYGGEELVLRQGLYVTPVLRQELVIVDSFAAGQPQPAADVRRVPLTPSFSFGGGASTGASLPSTPPHSASQPPVHSVAPLVEAGTAPVPASSVKPEQPRVRVVQPRPTDDWDE